MYKKILLISGIFFIVLAVGTIIFAFTSKINLENLHPNGDTEKNNQEVYLNISQDKYSLNNEKEKELIEKSKSYIPCL